jgi:hypothetical protein
MTPILRSPTPPAHSAPSEPLAGRRFALLWVAPVMLLLLAIALPLIVGTKTLYLRDVLNTHYEMKFAQAQAMREGRVPLIDLQRGGGQAHLANPNTVPLYPDNLLLLFTETLWAMNAHFWLHWLVAPFAGYWLGRALGMRREAAWAVGVVYVTSGFYMATLNLYNLVAPVTLAPALVASALDLGRPGRSRWAFVWAAAIWSLMILGGDPMTAAFCLLATLVVVAVRHGRSYPWLAAAGAVAIGTGLAAPQWVEFLRLLGFTYRGFWGFGYDNTVLGGFRPFDSLELLIPFFFGRPDVNYWGRAWHADQVPLFFTFYPGVLMLGLMAAARGDRRRTLLWAWGLVLCGVFLALGEANPVVVALSRLPGASLLRIPSKLWILVTLGSAVLCGLAVGRLFEADGRRRLARALIVIGVILFSAWALMTLWSSGVDAWVRRLMPEDFSPSYASVERLRWAGSTLLALLLTSFYLICLKAGPRRPALAPLALLLMHAATQIFFLRSVIGTDDRAPYLERPALLDRIPAGSRVAHGGNLNLFGKEAEDKSSYPDVRLLWRERQMHADLYPSFGVHGGLRYDFNLSPEGLDSFLTRAAVQSLWQLEDPARMRILQASGVDYLLLHRPLEEGLRDTVELVDKRPSPAGALHLYRLRDTAPPVAVVGRLRGSLNLNEALTMVLSPNFDFHNGAVLAGDHEPLDGEPGTARLIEETAESITVDVSAPGPGALVVQRTHLPIYRARLDGEPVALYAANLHRMAVKVPPGDHRVDIRVERGSLRWGFALSAVSLLALAGIAWRGGPASPPPAPAEAMP